MKNCLALNLCLLFAFTLTAQKTQKAPDLDCECTKPHNKKSAQIADTLLPHTVYTAQIKIPVVFHIIMEDQHLILKDSILAELQNLHNDFLLLNTDTSQVNDQYKKLICNPRIDFYLDTTLGDKGIIRKTIRATHDFYKYSPVISPETHLNIYIGDLRGPDGFVYSYPYLNKTTDGVYLTYKWIGRTYRLLTHETGHWLGLWHVFEGGCRNKDNGDDVDDTPPQNSSSYKSENQGNIPEDYKSACGDGIPFYNNFMDYSNYRRMFTEGQVRLMYQTLAKYRKLIWNNRIE